MNEHQFTYKQSHVYTHNKLEGHEIDFNNVEILDSADNDNKSCWKEMLYIRQHKPTLNTQDELLTLIIRNVQLESSITRDIQKNNTGEMNSHVNESNFSLLFWVYEIDTQKNGIFTQT